MLDTVGRAVQDGGRVTYGVLHLLGLVSDGVGGGIGTGAC